MKNTQKGFVAPLLIVIALLVIGGGMYIYENKKTEVPTVVDTTTQQSNQVQQANPQSNNTAPVPTTQNNQSSVKPSITILSPNGGEMWQEGKIYPIQWSAKNIPGNQTIKLVDSNNVVIRTIDPNINTVNGGTGLYQYSWSIPQVFVSEASPGKFRILISSSDNTVSDYSDNQFTIYASGGSQPVSNQSSINNVISSQHEKIQAYINVVDKNGQPFKATRVWWYYPPVNGAQATEYPATCVNNTCTRWSVTGAIGPKVYTAANYIINPTPGALCSTYAYDAKLVELSSSIAEVILTLNPGLYCYF